MLDACLVIIAKVVKAQAVVFRIDHLYQFGFDFRHSSSIGKALEYLVLDSLAVVHTVLCDFSKTFATSGVFGVYIVSDDNQHYQSPYFHKNGG